MLYIILMYIYDNISLVLLRMRNISDKIDNKIKTHILCSVAFFRKPCHSVAYPGIMFGGRGGSTNSVEVRGQREWGSGSGSPPVRGSGGSCNLVQEISFHVVKFSSFLVLLSIY